MNVNTSLTYYTTYYYLPSSATPASNTPGMVMNVFWPLDAFNNPIIEPQALAADLRLTMTLTTDFDGRGREGLQADVRACEWRLNWFMWCPAIANVTGVYSLNVTYQGLPVPRGAYNKALFDGQVRAGIGRRSAQRVHLASRCLTTPSSALLHPSLALPPLQLSASQVHITPGATDGSLFATAGMQDDVTAGVPHVATFAARDAVGNLAFLIPSYNASALQPFKQLWPTLNAVQSLANLTWSATYVPAALDVTANVTIALSGGPGVGAVTYRFFRAGAYAVAVQYKGAARAL